MPRDSGGPGRSKPEMIRAVLEADPGLPTPKVRAAVWERFGGEVTAREIAQARRKLREAEAPPAKEPEPAPAVATAARVKKERPSAAPKRKRRAAAAPRAREYARAEVTVKQLSAILEVAGEVGGLDRLREALQTVSRLRERVGDVDERQLGYALDFLAELTGKE